jgi:uncharacterized coiled-coil DUF342 family protein
MKPTTDDIRLTYDELAAECRRIRNVLADIMRERDKFREELSELKATVNTFAMAIVEPVEKQLLDATDKLAAVEFVAKLLKGTLDKVERERDQWRERFIERYGNETVPIYDMGEEEK